MLKMKTVHIPDIDLRGMKLIVELSELRKLTAAADRLGVSQSAASHALTRLRVRLGDQLFVRTVSGFQPTPYAERLAVASREALNTLAAALSTDQPFDPRSTTRRFTYYANDVGQMVSLPRLVAFLKREAPRATIRVASVPLQDPGAALASGEVDIAFGPFDNLITGFRQSLVIRERYVCIMRTNHPKFRGGMTLEAFKSSDQAIADATGLAHAAIDRFLSRHGIERNIILRVPGFHVLPTIIASSDLLAVIPRRLADAFASRLPIAVLPLPISVPPFDVNVYWHERYHRDAAVQWFRKVFIDLLRHNPSTR
jgi:DNA-binding transcriptional LysR family regulator